MKAHRIYLPLFFFLFSFAQLLQAVEPEILCEFDQPEIISDYWPVFHINPMQEDGTVPVVDIFLNKEGKPTRHAFLNSDDELIRALSSRSVEVMQFRPAIACGEYAEGFYRHAVRTYFYLDEGEQERITNLPASAFFITPEIQTALEIASSAANENVLRFSLKVTPDGKVRKLRGIDSQWAKELGSGIMETISKGFTFQPARHEDAPLEVGLILEMHLDKGLEWAIFGKKADKALKPMPDKPETEDLDLSKIHSVEVSFYENGRMQDIQFLTPMTEAESLASLSAFRNWRIAVPEKLKTEGDLVRRVTYGFTKDDEKAVLLEESTGPALILPVLKKRVAPSYPSELLRKGIGGVVVLHLVVDQEGKVADGDVILSSHPAFTKSVERVLKRWRFEPGTLDGKPVNIRAKMHIPFQIQ